MSRKCSQNSGCIAHSTTHVKPSRVGLGTGWVTSYKYLVVKCVLYSILFLNAKIN